MHLFKIFGESPTITAVYQLRALFENNPLSVLQKLIVKEAFFLK